MRRTTPFSPAISKTTVGSACVVGVQSDGQVDTILTPYIGWQAQDRKGKTVAWNFENVSPSVPACEAVRRNLRTRLIATVRREHKRVFGSHTTATYVRQNCRTSCPDLCVKGKSTFASFCGYNPVYLPNVGNGTFVQMLMVAEIDGYCQYRLAAPNGEHPLSRAVL